MKVADLWTDEAKWDSWRRVEVAICQALTEDGWIPDNAIEAIEAARIDTARVRVLEEETHHEMIAVLRTMAESAGDAGRYIHLGLTSSDVQDTAMGWTLTTATRAIIDGLVRLQEPAIGRRFLPGLIDHNLWRLDRAVQEIRIGKVSGAVGTHANVNAKVERRVCEMLDLMVEPSSSQIVARDRYAAYLSILACVAASLTCFPLTADPQREKIWDLSQRVRMCLFPAFESVALWHERDISHSSVERYTLPTATSCLDYMVRILLGEAE